MDEDLAVKIAIVESGGNPNAISSTGAIGIFQLTGGTATSVGVKNRFNVADNIEGGIKLLTLDRRFLSAAPTAVETYLALQLGGPTAKYVLSQDRSTPISSLKPSVASAIRKNIGGKSRTVGEYIDANEAALNTKVAENARKPMYAGSSIPAQSSVSAKSSPTTATPPPVKAHASPKTEVAQANIPKSSSSPPPSPDARESVKPSQVPSPPQQKPTPAPSSRQTATAQQPPQDIWKHPGNGMLIGV